MRREHSALLALPLTLASCMAPSASTTTLSSARAAQIVDSVRTFADGVARGVSRDGPAAWRGFFADTSAFFMASEGHLVFPSSDSASRGIDGLRRVIAHIELRWTDTVRVDPVAPGFALMGAPWHEVQVNATGHRIEEEGYFTGLVEHRPSGWQFRDAHWSVAASPMRAP